MATRRPPGDGSDADVPWAGDPQREREIEALLATRRALLPAEIALFREIFPVYFRAHFDILWRAICRQGAGQMAADVLQDVYLGFFDEVVQGGFPENVRERLLSLAMGKANNRVRAARREPVSLGLPSSRSEPPRSGPERLFIGLDLVHRLLPALSPEHREALDAVFIRGLTHDEAAAHLGLLRSTLTMRLRAAEKRLAALASQLAPESEPQPDKKEAP